MAISPIPVIAAVLMLLTPRARVTSVGFLLGWVVGIVVAVTVFTLLSGAIPESDPEAAKPVKGVIQLILGVLAILLAVSQWRKRPKAGEEPEMPKWMQAVDAMRFPAAAGFGFVMAAVNPKNLLLAASAGVTIGTAALSAGSDAVVIAVFTLIGASTVLIPVVGYLFAADRLRGPLDALRVWLARENALIMALLMLVIGVSLIGKGIGSF